MIDQRQVIFQDLSFHVFSQHRNIHRRGSFSRSWFVRFKLHQFSWWIKINFLIICIWNTNSHWVTVAKFQVVISYIIRSTCTISNFCFFFYFRYNFSIRVFETFHVNNIWNATVSFNTIKTIYFQVSCS